MKVHTVSHMQAARNTVVRQIPTVLALCTSFLLFSCGVSQTELLTEANSVEKRFSAKLQPTVRAWIDEEAMKLARFVVEEDEIGEAVGRRFAGQNLGDDGRTVLTFLMMTRAVELSGQRARVFEEQQKATRATVEKMREVLPKLEASLKKSSGLNDLAPVPPELAAYQEEIRKINDLLVKTPSRTTFVDRPLGDLADVRAVQEDIKGKLDGMNEMSEMTSLRLQMMMDRRSKFISTLSNIMKKISTTQDTLVQNLK